MVKKSIKIYARLKQEKPENTASYQVIKKGNHESITFYANRLRDFVNNRPNSHTFRFKTVFGEKITQQEVFNVIAKPIVTSVLGGFNGTVFAYGQTGSGKTYAMTGSPVNYENRGIIPRSIEEIFRYANTASEKFSVYISFVEIYNESGYDLLNPKEATSFTDELSSINMTDLPSNNESCNRSRFLMAIVNEDGNNKTTDNYEVNVRPPKVFDAGKGEFRLHNLRVYRVSTEKEAMQLLLLGDVNRMTFETPMNLHSSRSHCIFTIYLIARNRKSGKLRKSKLTLVDLAGSERIKKSNITGTSLHEAKLINLSLHYLEQVIITLAHGKGHVPFRNSLLTYLLKDSLSGNCLTVLLATLAVNKKNLEESIATCKFAQRVADVNLDANINAEIDTQQKIKYLSKETKDLEPARQTQHNLTETLTKEEKEKWKKTINNYMQDASDADELPVKSFDVRHMRYCFQILRQTMKIQESQQLEIQSAEHANKKLVNQYENAIHEKEEEIDFLKSLLCNECKASISSQSINYSLISKSNTAEKENIPPKENISCLSIPERAALQKLIQNKKNRKEFDFCKKTIEDIHEIAVNVIAVIEHCQKNILDLRTRIEANKDKVYSAKLKQELIDQQNIYRTSLKKLQELKNESEYFRRCLNQAELENFSKWYQNEHLNKTNNKNNEWGDDATSSTGHPEYQDFPCKKCTLNNTAVINLQKNETTTINNINAKSRYQALGKLNDSDKNTNYCSGIEHGKMEKQDPNGNYALNSDSLSFSADRAESPNFIASSQYTQQNRKNCNSNYSFSSKGALEKPRNVYTKPNSIEPKDEGYADARLCINTKERNINKNNNFFVDKIHFNRTSPTNVIVPNTLNDNSYNLSNDCPHQTKLCGSPSRLNNIFERRPYEIRNYTHSRNKQDSFVQTEKETRINSTEGKTKVRNEIASRCYTERDNDKIAKNIVELPDNKIKSTYCKKSSLFFGSVPQEKPIKKHIEDKLELNNCNCCETRLECGVVLECASSCNCLYDHCPAPLRTSIQYSSSSQKESQEFIDFMKNIPLTGDSEVDVEIINFYRSKFGLDTKMQA